jgi:hypothetical protein
MTAFRRQQGSYLRGFGPPHPRFLAALLEAAYPIPCEADAVRSDSRWARWTHTDLPALTPAELAAEERRVELRAVLDPAPSAWLSERLAAIRQERRNRGR